MTTTYNGNLQDSDVKVICKTSDYTYNNLEPSVGQTPRKTTTTYTVYINGNFWGKSTSCEYHGNWESKQKPQDTIEYDLTKSDSTNFWDVVSAVCGQSAI